MYDVTSSETKKTKPKQIDSEPVRERSIESSPDRSSERHDKTKSHHGKASTHKKSKSSLDLSSKKPELSIETKMRFSTDAPDADTLSDRSHNKSSGSTELAGMKKSPSTSTISLSVNEKTKKGRMREDGYSRDNKTESRVKSPTAPAEKPKSMIEPEPPEEDWEEAWRSKRQAAPSFWESAVSTPTAERTMHAVPEQTQERFQERAEERTQERPSERPQSAVSQEQIQKTSYAPERGRLGVSVAPAVTAPSTVTPTRTESNDITAAIEGLIASEPEPPQPPLRPQLSRTVSTR